MVLHLRPVAHSIVGLGDVARPNVITLGIKPGAIRVDVMTNGAGDKFDLESTSLHADMGDCQVSPYGEVLRGVLDRDLLLSVRDDFVEEAWRIVDPVLESWRAGERPLDEYPAGSTGPVRS